MDAWMTAAVGGGVAVGLAIAGARRAKANAALAPRIEALLDGGVERTLPELATALGMPSFVARGKVALALNELVAQGRVVVIPAAEGTPQLEKVNVIRYRRA